MKLLWKPEKNELLIHTRKVSFWDIEEGLAAGILVDLIEHPNQELHPGQYLILMVIRGTFWAAPVDPIGNGHWFIWTIYEASLSQYKHYLGDTHAKTKA